MKAINGKLLWNLVYIICLSFLLFLVIIHFNNRINNSDDFFFLTRLNELGFWKSIREWEFNQRPVSHFIFNLTFYFSPKVETLRWSLFIGNLSIIFLLIHSLKIVVAKLFSLIEIQLENRKQWAFATLIAMCAFFFCIERSEVWFWYICTVIYLVPFVLLNYGSVLLFDSRKQARFLAAVFFLLIGGTLELMIPIVGSLLIVFYLNRKITLWPLILNGSALLFFSLFQLVNSGVEKRLQLESAIHDEYNSTFASTFSHFFDQKNVFFILLLIMISMLLQEYRISLAKINFKKIISWLSSLLLVYFLATWLISVKVFSGSFGVLRMWAPFSFFLMVLILVFTIWIAVKYKKELKLVGLLASVIFVALFTYFSVKQIEMTSNYARSYDLVVAGKSVESSPDSGIIVSTGDFELLIEYLKSNRQK